MKILIAYDGSEYGDAAINDLRRAGLPDNAEATVFCVAEEWFPPPPPSSYETVEAALSEGIAVRVERTKEEGSQWGEQARQSAAQAAQLVKSHFPGWQVSAEAISGSPATEILAKADDENADLIVVGSQGRGPLSRMILGSVSQRVVTEAHCSVRVARSGSHQKGLSIRVIVGLDPSPDALAAVHVVAERKWPANTEVRLVTAVDFYDVSTMTPEEKAAGVAGALHSAETVLKEARLQVSSLSEEKPPKYLLVDEAERWQADCIFVGARGLTRLGRILLGSVSTAVVSRAHCSVEVVRQR
jgi:nucleotide-binding universal stress UspA family protein